MMLKISGGILNEKKVITIVILLLLIAGGVTFFNQQKSTQSANELTLYGNINIREVQLKANASEHITHIYVQEGDAEAAQAEAASHALSLAIEGSREEDIAIAEAQLKAKQASVQIAKQHSQYA